MKYLSLFKILATALLVTTSNIAKSDVLLECNNAQAIPLPLEISLNESNKSGTVKMQFSKQTKCEYIAQNWIYSPDEIRFEFHIDTDSCGRNLSPLLLAKLDRKSGKLFLGQANGSGDVLDLACSRSENANKF